MSRISLAIIVLIFSFLIIEGSGGAAAPKNKASQQSVTDKENAATMEFMEQQDKMEKEMEEMDRKDQLSDKMALEDLIDKARDCILNNDYACSKNNLDAAKGYAKNDDNVRLLKSAWDYHNERQRIFRDEEERRREEYARKEQESEKKEQEVRESEKATPAYSNGVGSAVHNFKTQHVFVEPSGDGGLIAAENALRKTHEDLYSYLQNIFVFPWFSDPDKKMWNYQRFFRPQYNNL